MTTPEIPAESNENAPEAPEAPSEGKGLRAQLESSLAENRTLKAEKLDATLEGIGLTRETGMGKMMAEKFDSGEVELENVVTVLTQDYGFTAPNAPIEQHPAAEAIHEGNARQEAIGQQSGSIAPPTPSQAVAQAEADGNYDQAMAMKAAEVASWFAPKAS